MALMFMLSGCTVNSSVLGNGIAGIAGAGEPSSTASIVPQNDEAAVVDLPDAGNRAKGSPSGEPVTQSSSDAGAVNSAGYDQARGTVDEQADEQDLQSPEELHRQELVNRGDLPEGAPLPAGQ